MNKEDLIEPVESIELEEAEESIESVESATSNLPLFHHLERPELHLILEGAIMASNKPLTIDQLALLFPEQVRPDNNEISKALTFIAEACEHRGFELKQVASGFRFQIKQSLAPWVGRLWEEKPQRYTRALLETLALIAYRQPITRGEIEDVRGVSVSSNIIRTLQEREWIRVVGHRDVPGRPAMFATTRHFLDYFNLENLNDLPSLSEIRDLETAANALEHQIDILDNIKQGEQTNSVESEEESKDISAETLFAKLDEIEAGLPVNFHDLIKKQKDKSTNTDTDNISPERLDTPTEKPSKTLIDNTIETSIDRSIEALTDEPTESSLNETPSPTEESSEQPEDSSSHQKPEK
ncbi:MAG: SMC-Scp complex subunit ScpB [Candidatus Endonucleobacter bathymodioli]|uniref:SMC-Scp complex subunit ScpB n=1 Tax=Candidatus Endonucleibacter bathymodioli TaxID=539814 RepID=A0AA90NLN3_9GAMM|nr:SMC-Scp complex subunit ScpB [Candidatus Endonucleobacter bathymodioli]